MNSHLSSGTVIIDFLDKTYDETDFKSQCYSCYNLIVVNNEKHSHI